MILLAAYLLGEVVECHPELALVPDPGREELLVALRQRVPLPAALAPRPVPLPFAPRVPQSAMFNGSIVSSADSNSIARGVFAKRQSFLAPFFSPQVGSDVI